MVDMLVMFRKHQKQQKQQQQQPHNEQQNEQLFSRRNNKTLHQKEEEREEDFYYTLTEVNKTPTTTNSTCFANTFNKNCSCYCCCGNNITLKYHYNKWKSIKSNGGFSVGVVCGGGSGLWLVLLVFMLILCGNPAISQQRNINNSIKQNNSYNIANILLQISTPLPPSPQADVVAEATQTTNNNRVAASVDGDSVGTGIIVADNKEKQVFFDDTIRQRQRQSQLPAKSNVITKTTISSSTSSSSSSSFSSSSSSRSSSSISNNAPTLGISNSASNNNFNYNRSNLKSNNNETLLNNGESISAASTNSHNNDNDDNNSNSNEDLLNSSEILNESEDGFEHSTSTTPRTLRSTIAPALTAAQERERRLMNVLAARRSALQRPGFRNRIGTTGRTATAVETTSKSPTDPRSICIRNCTKNFTRRTTASCMRQCANFSKVASSIPGAGTSTVVVKNSSKTGTGTAQAGEKDTNEILFTDESSHGLLVIAKEQNDTLNHINDDKKTGVAGKLRGRRKPQNQLGTVTLATTSIEDDEIQPYLYFGQKLPPLKPNTLTITAVSDEHPKLLEVSVADAEPSSTTPVAIKSTHTLSLVEKSRSRFNYSMRNGLTSTRKYNSVNRTTTTQVPAELRTTTLRIVAEKEPKIKIASLRKTTSPRPVTQALRDESTFSPSTPLIITVLGDDEIVTPTPEPITVFNAKMSEALRESTTWPTTTVTQSKSTDPTTTTTTSTTPPATMTTRKAITTPLMNPSSTEAISTTTSTTTVPITYPATESKTSTTFSTSKHSLPIYRAAIYQPPMPTTTTTTSTTTTTTTPAPTISTQKTILSEKDTEILRAIGESLAEPINTDDTNLIIFVNRTTDIYRPSPNKSKTTPTQKPHIHLETFIPHQRATTDSSTTIIHTTILTSIRSTINSRNKDLNIQTTTTPSPTASSQKGPFLNHGGTPPSSTTLQPVITGEISSTVVTDDQEISMEMHRMNIVTMVLAGIGIVPLLAIIVYLLRNYLLKRPIKDDEDFDVCITDQQPISPVKKIDAKYQEDDEDEVDHQKKPPLRQHSLHNKLVSAPLARDNNHNVALNQQRYDDKSSVTSDQEFDRTNIRLKSLLGEGNFGQVWKAEADDLSGHFGATRIVAVKTIKACSTQLSLKDEANIMRKLGSHQNVVTLLGACVDSEPHMLIMEYAMRGRLLSLLRAARNATNILPASVPGGRSLTPLSPRTLAGFCVDIARGMEYIAEKRIVHRDLAARNVLLDHNGVCKICDFGMSIDLDAERKRKELEKNCANEIMRSNFNKFKFDFGGKFIMNHWPQHSPKECNEKKTHGHDTIGKRPALPIRWMAPEALQYNIFTTETDIWAFGIVLWEIATLGSTPYSQITGREVIRRVPQGLRPDLPKEGRHEFYNLMSRCWHKDPHMRPSFSQCRLEISRSLHKWVDDDSAASDYMDVSGFSEDLEQGMVYFNHRISEFECEI